MCKKWLQDKVDRMSKAPLGAVFGGVLGKFVAGVGIGILLVRNLPQLNWSCAGWDFLLIGILLGLPLTKAVYLKK
jgi:hypothetical protein